MILTQYVDLPDGRQAEAKARWNYSQGTPGTLSDQRGWELVEFWVPGMPRLTLDERRHVERQLNAPENT